MAIKLIVGLGNPGEKYRFNRHNSGFVVIDAIANNYNAHFLYQAKFFADIAKININTNQLILLKPQTYMNNSAKSVSSIVNFFSINPEQILVVHDDLDLEFSDIRIKIAGGHGGHNGLRDIISHIGNNFYRLRMGIGRPVNHTNVSNFVLSDFTKNEKKIIDSNILLALTAIPGIINGDITIAMQKLQEGLNGI